MNLSRAAAVAIGLIALMADTATAADSLAVFSGRWTGSGAITAKDGSRERIRCRSSNTAEGNSISLSLRCASDSYKFELASDISSDRGNLSGSWNETTRGVFGQLSGRMAGSRIQAMVSAIGFSASLSLAAHGNSLSVTIRTPDSDISDVTVTLARSGH